MPAKVLPADEFDRTLKVYLALREGDRTRSALVSELGTAFAATYRCLSRLRKVGLVASSVPNREGHETIWAMATRPDTEDAATFDLLKHFKREESAERPEPGESTRFERGPAKSRAPKAKPPTERADRLKPGDVIADPSRTRGRAIVRRASVAPAPGTLTLEYQPVHRDGAPVGLEKFTTLAEGARVRLFETAGSSTVPETNDAAKPQKEKGSNMTKVTRKGAGKAKAGSKGKGKTAAKAKPAAAKASNRRTAEDVAKLVPTFLKHLNGGGSMQELKKEHGFSDDGPIRAALYRAGYHKVTGEGYVKHGVEAGSVDASKAAGKKQVVKLRTEGAGWYVLSHMTGLTESEVKAIVADAGGPTGRVYREPAPKAKAAPKAKSAGSKGKGKTVSRKATAADPS